MEFKELFKIDREDYDADGKIYARPSVRGMVIKDGKALLIHSQKYDFYKFPGGGIEAGESFEEALIREMKEETGYDVIKESIEPFGKVTVKYRDKQDEHGIFLQENYYYFCDVMDEKGEVNLDDYEKEDGYEAVWKEPFPLHFHNLNCKGASVPKNKNMIKRESTMFDIVDLEIRKRNRDRREKELLTSLPKPDEDGRGDYFSMLSFVESVLKDPTEDMSSKIDIYYSRFEHTKRVLGWLLRLYNESPNKSGLRYTDLIIATIFHDVGRPAGDAQGISHAKAGGPITREYLYGIGYEEERVEYIATLVEKHSDKYLMENESDDEASGMDPNLLMLMEADLLDDMGAQGIVMDCMITEKRNPKAQFTDCLDHMTRYTRALQKNNPMVSEAGKRMWDEKTKLVDLFVDAFERDCTLS